jgi:hypothetical protein
MPKSKQSLPRSLKLQKLLRHILEMSLNKPKHSSLPDSAINVLNRRILARILLTLNPTFVLTRTAKRATLVLKTSFTVFNVAGEDICERLVIRGFGLKLKRILESLKSYDRKV